MLDTPSDVRQNTPLPPANGELPSMQNREIVLPMVASFWRNGKFEKFECTDCRIYSGETHTEITLKASDDRYHLFVVTADPEIQDQMSQDGQVKSFDGFLLRGADGKIIEKITAFDSHTTH